MINSFFRQYAETYRSYKNGRWCYEDGCFYKGLADLYLADGQAWYLDRLVEHVNLRIGTDGTIEGYDREEYSLDNINAGKVLLFLHQRTGDPRYDVALRTLREQFFNHPRTRDGNLWHKKGYPWQVWLDGLYMGPPVLAQFSLAHEDGAALDDVRRQFENVRRIMYDPASGLYYHGYDESRQATWADPETGLSSCFWSRAIGWFAMATVDIYGLLPEGHEHRPFYADLLRNICVGVAAWQQDDGLWMQIMNQPARAGNYVETSASAMFAYVFLKGCRLGILPDRYATAGRRAFDGIVHRHVEAHRDGVRMGGICLMAGLGDLSGQFGYRDGKFDYYISEPVVDNDPKGVGPLMMAQAELIRQEEAGLVPTPSL